MRILVVEDHSVVRGVVVEMLESIGYQVSAVCDGEEARMLLLEGEVFDFIITDNDMPRLKGVDLVLWFINEFRGQVSGTKLIISSGDSTSEIDRLCLVYGIDSLPKPIEMKKLRAVLAHAL